MKQRLDLPNVLLSQRSLASSLSSSSSSSSSSSTTAPTRTAAKRSTAQVVPGVGKDGTDNDNDDDQHDGDVTVPVAAVQSMIRQLSDDELEVAARASHEYHRTTATTSNHAFATPISDNEGLEDYRRRRRRGGGGRSSSKRRNRHRSVDDDDDDDDDVNRTDSLRRDWYASQMIRRYLSLHNNNVQRAMDNMKETLLFRKHQIDTDDPLVHAPTNRSSPQYIPMRQQLATKKLYVQGYDKDGRSTYYFIPRCVKTHHLHQNHHHPNRFADDNDKYTLRSHIWTMERAVACSKCDDRTINAVVDFDGFCPTKHTPSYAVGRDLLTVLSKHYIHHIHHIYLVDAPFAFLCLWNMYKSFACPRTRSKIHFIQSNTAGSTDHRHPRPAEDDDDDVGFTRVRRTQRHRRRRQRKPRSAEGDTAQRQQQQHIDPYRAGGASGSSMDLLQELYTPDQLPSWIVPNGQKNRELDVDEYLDRIPFDHSFDE